MALGGFKGFVGGLSGVPVAQYHSSLSQGIEKMRNQPKAGEQLDQDLEAAMQYLQPYMDVAQPALQGLQQLSTPQGQANAVGQYTQSPLYQQQMESAQQAAARTASATGGLRSGASVLEQSSIPLALQQQYLNDQTNRLGQLAGFGTQPASQAFSGTIGQGQFGQQLAQNKQIANQQAMQAKDQQSSNFWGNLLGIGASLIL